MRIGWDGTDIEGSHVDGRQIGGGPGAPSVGLGRSGGQESDRPGWELNPGGPWEAAPLRLQGASEGGCWHGAGARGDADAGQGRRKQGGRRSGVQRPSLGVTEESPQAEVSGNGRLYHAPFPQESKGVAPLPEAPPQRIGSSYAGIGGEGVRKP